jgi:hypothetical protein
MACQPYSDSYYSHLPDAEHRSATCQKGVSIGMLYGLDPEMVAALLMEEQRHADKDYEGGIRGPFQVSAKDWCEGGTFSTCADLNIAGARAISLLRNCSKINWSNYECKRERRKPLPWSKVLCHYASGNKCTKKGLAYTKRVMRWRNNVRRYSRLRLARR